MTIKNCVVCNAVFQSTGKYKCCSDVCRQERNRQITKINNAKANAKNKRLNPFYQINCHECGSEFTAKTPNAMFCSKICNAENVKKRPAKLNQQELQAAKTQAKDALILQFKPIIQENKNKPFNQIIDIIKENVDIGSFSEKFISEQIIEVKYGKKVR